MKGEILLKVENLSVSYVLGERRVKALRSVNLNVPKGSVVALVGESGSGKTTLVRSIIRVLPRSAVIEGGRILFEDMDLLKLNESDMEKIRGRKVAMVFQDPISHLNPVMTIREQLAEVLQIHRGLRKDEVEEEALRLLTLMRLKDPKRVLSLYPHQLSGGMAQRILIAMALASNPSLLIADEPTSALDPTIQVKILNLLKEIHERNGLTIILVTHDLSVVAYIADYVYVMYGGRIMESGNVFRIFKKPLHPYTRELLSSITGVTNMTFKSIGDVPEMGCPYTSRCPFVMSKCLRDFPPYIKVGDDVISCYAVDIGELFEL